MLVNCSPGESSGLAALLKGKRTGQAGEQNPHNVALFSQAVKSRDEILSRCELLYYQRFVGTIRLQVEKNFLACSNFVFPLFAH